MGSQFAGAGASDMARTEDNLRRAGANPRPGSHPLPSPGRSSALLQRHQDRQPTGTARQPHHRLSQDGAEHVLLLVGAHRVASGR